jgi:hypothetical protein
MNHENDWHISSSSHLNPDKNLISFTCEKQVM